MAGLKLISSSLKATLEDADVPLDWDSCSIQNQLYDGIFLNKGTKKFWVDKKTNSHAITIYARCLSITWIEDARYWKWTIVKEPCGNSMEVAELLKVSWLDIGGKIPASVLSPGIEYEVVFEVMIRKVGTGWQIPVTIELKVPNQCTHRHKENLIIRLRDQWFEIPAGTFTLSEADTCGCPGDIEFSLFEHGGHWKTDLLLKSVVIRPKLPLC